MEIRLVVEGLYVSLVLSNPHPGLDLVVYYCARSMPTLLAYRIAIEDTHPCPCPADQTVERTEGIVLSPALVSLPAVLSSLIVD